MFRRAQDRVRTYYYKTKDELLRSKDIPLSRVVCLLTDLQARLRAVKYFGCYFDRSACLGEGNLKSICDEKGEFSCQGRWDRDACLYTPVHKINPYTSREERIVFQTWNLDHLKERSRSIIPAICEALKVEGGSVKANEDCNIDVKGIFNDLFTLKNLKFVHIVCHDKGAHLSKTAGPYLLY